MSQLAQLEQQSQEVRAHAQQLEQAKLVCEAASLAKTEFLANMSHELRTPLNAVLGLSQALQAEIFGELTPKQAEYVNYIYNSGEYLLELINDILDLAKIKADQEELTLTPISLPQLCRDCLALVPPAASSKGLQTIQQYDRGADCCYADERRLKQVLLNLLANAVKFTTTGTISLITQRHAQNIAITVSDTGLGIAPEKLLVCALRATCLPRWFLHDWSGPRLGGFAQFSATPWRRYYGDFALRCGQSIYAIFTRSGQS